MGVAQRVHGVEEEEEEEEQGEQEEASVQSGIFRRWWYLATARILSSVGLVSRHKPRVLCCLWERSQMQDDDLLHGDGPGDQVAGHACVGRLRLLLVRFGDLALQRHLNHAQRFGKLCLRLVHRPARTIGVQFQASV